MVSLMAVFLMASAGPIHLNAAPYAYIPNQSDNTVSVIDTSTNTSVTSINVGAAPFGVAVNAAGTRVYITNTGANSVSVIDTSMNTVVGSPIAVGVTPMGIALNPEGTRLYVANYGDDTVSVIDTSTNTRVTSIIVGSAPFGVAVNPAGTRLYVANSVSKTISVIDTYWNAVDGPPIGVGKSPWGITVHPLGTRVYVANAGDNTVSVVDASSNAVIGPAIGVGITPLGIALNPTGTHLYVANNLSHTVSVIDTSSNVVVGSPTVGQYPVGIAVNPGGTRVYVANSYDDTLSIIDVSTNSVVGLPITVGSSPQAFGLFIGPPFDPHSTTIPLSQGWNFISIPKQPPNTSIDHVLSGVSTNVAIIWGRDNQGQSWLKYKPSGSNNTLTALEPGKGYWVYMNNPDSLLLTGTDAPPGVHLYQGWNLVGYNGVDGTPVQDALASIGYHLWSVVWGWENGIWLARHEVLTSFPNPISPLTVFNKKKAFWIKTKQSIDWAQ
jgi:YVTN family beta-propeller protein